MNKILLISIILILPLIGGCTSNQSNIPDNKCIEEATEVIDSIISLENGVKIKNISIVKMKMPALLAEENREELKKSFEAVFLYLLGSNIGKKEYNDPEKKVKIEKDISAILTPVRKNLKEYEQKQKTEYLFALLHLSPENDSSLNEKRIYILNSDDVSKIERKQIISNKERDGFLDCASMLYAPEDNIDISKSEIAKFKEITDNPVYNFIANE